MPFCYIALHGCCHLKLEHCRSLLSRMIAFKKDLDDGLDKLRSFGLHTSMYVYPYVYSFPGSDRLLVKSGMKTIVGSNALFRTSVESLIDGKLDNFA